MDYYSGAPDPQGYDDFNNANYGNASGGNNFFKDNSTLILICLGVAIVILMLMFLFITPSKKEYNTLDKDSSLSSLEVFGGTLSPSFSKDVVKYKIEATSPNVSFDCKASSSKASVEGCDKSVEVTDGKVEYNIKVTAEDGNITRYYFTIVKAEGFDE